MLNAVKDLFPTVFAELTDLRSVDAGERNDKVKEWALRHNIDCAAVTEMAEEMIAGAVVPPATITVQLLARPDQQVAEPPQLSTLLPFDETRDEYLERARKHYQAVTKWYLDRGFRWGTVKRERDHFGYLAARLVGGHSCAEIASGKVAELRTLAAASEKTIAGETLKIAAIIGLTIPDKRQLGRGP